MSKLFPSPSLAAAFHLVRKDILSRGMAANAPRFDCSLLSCHSFIAQFSLAVNWCPFLLRLATKALIHLCPVVQNRKLYAEALQDGRQAISLYHLVGDSNAIARLYARSARAVWYAGDPARSLALCQEGLAALEGRPETLGMAALLHETARACYFEGLTDQARQFCLQALEIAERLGAVEVQAEALATFALLPGQPAEECLAALTRAAELAEPAGLLATAIRAHTNQGIILGEKLGKIRAGRDHHQRAAELAQTRGSLSQELLSLLNVLDASLFLGDLVAVEKTLPVLRQLIGAAGDPGPATYGFRITLARLLRYRGDVAEAAEMLRVCQAEARQRQDLHHQNAANRFLAEILLELGELDEVESTLLETIAISDRGWEWNSVWPYCLLCVAHIRQGRLEDARSSLLRAREKADPQSFLFDKERLSLAEARLAVAERNWPAAMSAFETATKIEAQMELRWYQAHTLREWAEAHLARGEPGDFEQALRKLRQALAAFEEMGVSYYITLVRDRLQSL
jgi:tetratricopeptide (TPR) repeat protein